MLPKDYPPWQTVYYHFNKWKKTGVWEKIHDRLRIKTREKQGRDPNPSAAIIDSQSVKTTEQGGPRGYDAGKKIKGRKRHILVDTIGLILSVLVHEANIQDSKIAMAPKCFYQKALVVFHDFSLFGLTAAMPANSLIG